MSSPLLPLFSLLLLLLLLLPSPSSASPRCETYSQSFCDDVINYPIYLDLYNQDLGEAGLLATGIENVTLVGGKVNPLCADIARKYSCATAFPRCGAGVVRQEVCRSVCERFVSECSEMLIAFGREDAIPECQTAADCVDFDYMEVLPADFECPSPLIRKPAGVNSSNCLGECCVPCPQGQYFYPEGWMESQDIVVSVLCFMSFMGAFIVMMTYILAPEKRSYPQYVILCMSASLFIWYLPLVIGIRDRNIVRCIDEVNPSSPGNNLNPICYFQSIVTIYFILTAAAWYLVLVVNVYCNVIFLSQRLSFYHKYLHIVCWVLPAIPTIVALAMNKTGFVFGTWCAVDFGIYMDLIMMLPLALVIFPSVLLNLHVLIRIAIIAKQRHASLKSILQLQLRFFVFVMVVLFIFLVYWLQYEIKMKEVTHDVHAPWIKDWFFCIASGNGRNACSSLALPHVPDFKGFVLSEICISMLGIAIFAFFGMRMEIWHFWVDVFKGNFNRIRDVSFSTTEMTTFSEKERGSSKGTTKMATENEEQVS